MIKLLNFFCFAFFFVSCQNNSNTINYYFDSVNGNDNNEGISIEKPFKTLKKIKDINLSSGDSILLSNGSSFEGNIKIINKKNIHLSNYNSNILANPIIDSKGHIAGIYIENSSDISLSNIKIIANGGGVFEEYKNLTTNKITDKAIMRAGVLVNVSKNEIFKNILVRNIDVSDIFFEDSGFIRNPKEVRTAMGTQAYGFGIRFFNSSESGSLHNINVLDCS